MEPWSHWSVHLKSMWRTKVWLVPQLGGRGSQGEWIISTNQHLANIIIIVILITAGMVAIASCLSNKVTVYSFYCPLYLSDYSKVTLAVTLSPAYSPYTHAIWIWWWQYSINIVASRLLLTEWVCLMFTSYYFCSRRVEHLSTWSHRLRNTLKLLLSYVVPSIMWFRVL